MTDVCFIRPESDQTELLLSSYAASYEAAIAGDPDVNIIADLKGPAATRKAASSGLNQGDVIIYFGHGTSTSLGEDASTGQPLLDKANLVGAHNRSFIALACDSSSDLGQDAASSGSVSSYVGFDEPFFNYALLPSITCTPVQDALMEIRPGETPQRVVDKMKAGFEVGEWHFRYGPGSQHPDAWGLWLGLRMNHRGLRCDGDCAKAFP